MICLARSYKEKYEQPVTVFLQGQNTILTRLKTGANSAILLDVQWTMLGEAGHVSYYVVTKHNPHIEVPKV